MRQIHPVGFQEKFVASGVYTHYRNAEPTGLIESWNIYQLPDQAHLVRIDRDGRKDEFHRDTMLFEALYDPGPIGENLNRLDVHIYPAADKNQGGVGSVTKASYTFFDDHVLVNRKLDEGQSLIDEYKWSPQWIVCPAETCLLTGFSLALFLAQPDTKTETFYYQPAYKDKIALHKYLSDATLHFTGEEEMPVTGKTCTARKYEQFSSEDLNPKLVLWLDKHTILLRQKSLSLDEEVILTQYARRPEPRLS